MRFNARISFTLLTSLCLVSSCGLLGEKKKANLFTQSEMGGCFDSIAPRTTRFFNGEIEASEWDQTFDCVETQVKSFKDYVRGSTPGAYTKFDIGNLVRRLLITNRPVSDAFISSIFDIKASVFGGSPDLIYQSELDEFLRLNNILRRESIKLLPALQRRKKHPTTENMLALATGLDSFGVELGKYLKSLHGTLDVDKTSFIPFARELIDMSGGDRTLVDRYGDFMRNMKVMVTGGNPDKIETTTWPILIREGAAFGGLLLAYADMEDQGLGNSAEKDQFTLDLVYRLQTALNRVIAGHGQGIPLNVFDPVIDTLPWDELSLSKRKALKHDLRQISYRALKGGIKDWFTPAAIQSMVTVAEQGFRGQIHLKKIYEKLPLVPQLAEFEVAARAYLGSLPCPTEKEKEKARKAGIKLRDQCEEVNRLLTISKTFVGLFGEGSGEMHFTKTMRGTRSRNHMMRMSWFRAATDHLLSVYATGPENVPGQKSAKASDLANLTDDFRQVLQEWKLAHPTLTSIEMAKKRFREGNLFMPNSNGDLYFENAETSYYIAFLFSASSFSGRIFREVTSNRAEWSACPITGLDELGQDAMDADCFRSRYFSHPEIFWGNFPGLQVAYAKLSSEGKAQMARSMEAASRRGGYNEKPIGPFDIDSFAALPHYVEDMMERFDENQDQVLDEHEITDFAFPILRSTLAEKPCTNNAYLLKLILTYIVHNGTEPSGGDLALWAITSPFTKIEADRNSVYNVVALLSVEPDPNAPPSKCSMNDEKVLQAIEVAKKLPHEKVMNFLQELFF